MDFYSTEKDGKGLEDSAAWKGTEKKARNMKREDCVVDAKQEFEGREFWLRLLKGQWIFDRCGPDTEDGKPSVVKSWVIIPTSTCFVKQQMNAAAAADKIPCLCFSSALLFCLQS